MTNFRTVSESLARRGAFLHDRSDVHVRKSRELIASVRAPTRAYPTTSGFHATISFLVVPLVVRSRFPRECLAAGSRTRVVIVIIVIIVVIIVVIVISIRRSVGTPANRGVVAKAVTGVARIKREGASRRAISGETPSHGE